MATFNYKMVIVVRRDLKLSPGKMAAQVAHAAVNCALIAKKRSPMYFDAWYNEGQKKAVLKVNSLLELHEIKAAAEAVGLVVSLIVDAGMTELVRPALYGAEHGIVALTTHGRPVRPRLPVEKPGMSASWRAARENVRARSMLGTAALAAGPISPMASIAPINV